MRPPDRSGFAFIETYAISKKFVIKYRKKLILSREKTLEANFIDIGNLQTQVESARLVKIITIFIKKLNTIPHHLETVS